jgi:hypothetical protein
MSAGSARAAVSKWNGYSVIRLAAVAGMQTSST